MQKLTEVEILDLALLLHENAPHYGHHYLHDYIRKKPWSKCMVHLYKPICCDAMSLPGGRLNKKDGLTRYGDSHVKDKTS